MFFPSQRFVIVANLGTPDALSSIHISDFELSFLNKIEKIKPYEIIASLFLNVSV